MIGAIAGDMIGSPYEGRPIKTKDFPLFSDRAVFTDDTVLTVAVADALLHHAPYSQTLRNYGRRYPDAGYGRRFKEWFQSDTAGPYQALSNGSAMRVAPVGWACDSLDAVMQEAANSARVTHDHPQGIRGAQAVAVAIFLARKQESRQGIRAALERSFQYDLGRSLDSIRPRYQYDVTCQGSVPEALIAFLESDSFEDAVRNAVSLGGDSDTQAAMAGAIAEAYYGGVPVEIQNQVFARLDVELAQVVKAFTNRYKISGGVWPRWRDKLHGLFG